MANHIRTGFTFTLTALLLLMAALSFSPLIAAQDGPRPGIHTPASPVSDRRADTMERASDAGLAGAAGFSCNADTHVCSCRMSTPDDCKLMKSLVCKTVPDCPGSSQTCTCKSIK